MSASSHDSSETKMLTRQEPAASPAPAPGPVGPSPSPSASPVAAPSLVREVTIVSAEPSSATSRPPVSQPAPSRPATAAARPAGGLATRQLSELPKDELNHLAEEYGLDPTRYKSRPHLVAGIHERRQLIASLDREAMLDVIRWGRRPVTFNASREQIAQEIVRIRTMKFAGLSQRGLVVLGRLRGVAALESDDVPVLIKKLKKQEGLFAKLSRKRRAAIGAMVSKIVGESDAGGDYQFLPNDGSPNGAAAAGAAGGGAGGHGIKDDIEEAGLFGGITSRIKKSADAYVNQKLDEIEARIDRKLDEIDRRLAEWRDKEIANRIRIMKITLWASVIVGAFSLMYTYVKVYFYPDAPRGVRYEVRPQHVAPPPERVPTTNP